MENNENIEQDNNTLSSNEKKSNGKKAIIGMIILFLIIAIGGGVSYLYLDSKNDDDSNKKNVVDNDSKNFYSTYRMSGNSLEKFDIEFLKFENEEKNKVYSPLSIKYALQMLSEGSSGKSKSQIDAIIGDYKPVKYVNNDHMSFANAMFIRNEFSKKIKDDYKSTLLDKYNAEIITDDFTSASNINKWVNDKTFKLIDGLVDDNTVGEANFILVNALAIDMKWENLLQCENIKGNDVPCKKYNVNYKHENYNDYVTYITDPDDISAIDFYGKSNIKAYDIAASINNYDIVKELGKDNIYKTISTEYAEWLKSDEAKQADEVEEDVDKYTKNFIEELDSNYKKTDTSTDFMIYNDENVKVFAKDLQEYDGMTLQYVGIMPKNDNLSSYIKNTNTESINNIINDLKRIEKNNFKDGVVTKIKGLIPVFEFEYDLNLIDDLKKMGVNDIFDINSADLSNMLTDSTKQYIGSASHKANIAFSNQGIKASAATALAGLGSTTGPHFEHLYDVPVEEIDMTFDKPYMFLIRDKNSGEVWFTGTVYEPLTK